MKTRTNEQMIRIAHRLRSRPGVRVWVYYHHRLMFPSGCVAWTSDAVTDTAYVLDRLDRYRSGFVAIRIERDGKPGCFRFANGERD